MDRRENADGTTDSDEEPSVSGSSRPIDPAAASADTTEDDKANGTGRTGGTATAHDEPTSHADGIDDAASATESEPDS